MLNFIKQLLIVDIIVNIQLVYWSIWGLLQLMVQGCFNQTFDKQYIKRLILVF